MTPFTYQVRKRALHAALVIALRHGCDALTANTAAGRLGKDDARVQAVVEALKRRCRRADADAADDTAAHLDRLVDEWHDEAARCKRERRGLQYDCRDNAADRLLGDFDGARRGRWKTLNSMRVGHPQELIISRHSSTDPVDDDAVAGRRHGWGLSGDGVCAAAG